MLEEHNHHAGPTTLHFAVSREVGPPLVFLHGVTRDGRTFLPLLPTLGQRWRTYILDLRGHGRSGRSQQGYRVIDYATDVVAFLRGALRESAVVYGHSLGSMVAAAVAALAPERVRAVVLEDPPFDTMGRRITATSFHSYFLALKQLVQGISAQTSVHQLAQELANTTYHDPVAGATIRLGDIRDAALLRYAAQCLIRLDPRVLDPIVAGEWMQGYDRDGLLAAIRCPVLLLQGDSTVGGMLMDDDADAVVARVPDCTLLKLPGVGHSIHAMEPQLTLRFVLPFLEALDDR